MSTELGEGQSFGQYQLLEVAGTGGMGVVYRARQRSLGRIVALKVIRPEIAQSSDYRSRFLREARLAAAVDHPNIVSVFEVGEQDGRLYLAMQWVDGLELRTILDREQRLEQARAVRIGTQLAMALDAVHKAGLLHRDVKPANVLVRDIGGHDHAYLADFGIAKMPDAEPDITRTGWVIGTPGYLAPEQLEGGRPDPRSDLYALGCIVFETLTGHRPFGDPNGHAWQWDDPRKPRPLASAACPSLGPRYDAFFARALATDPGDRFQSGHEFAGALQAAYTQQPAAPAYTPTAPARPAPQPDDRPTIAEAPPAHAVPPQRTGPPADQPAVQPAEEPPTAPSLPVPGPAGRDAGTAPPAARPGSRPGPAAARPGSQPGPPAAQPGNRPGPPAAGPARKGLAGKLAALVCCVVFLASVTLLTNYYRDPGGKSLLQTANGDPNSPLYPQDFWIPVVLAALAGVLAVASIGVRGRSLMVCATAAALGLTGFTLYLPTKGIAPGLGPFGPGYWVSLAAAAVMAVSAGVAAVLSSRRPGGSRKGR